MGNNNMGNNSIGILIESAVGLITTSGNLVNNSTFGIAVIGETTALTLSNNTLSTLITGILSSAASNLTIKGNLFLSSVTGFGIDLGCQATGLTLSGNTFMGGGVGIADVPSGASLPKNLGTFIGVPTIEQLCP
jgi:Leucine-rich repeat (LRR) protein